MEIGKISREQMAAFEREVSAMSAQIEQSQKSWVYIWAASEEAMKKEIMKGYARYYIDKENKTNSEE